jgi:methionine synthase II (cobalamin-independent)
MLNRLTPKSQVTPGWNPATGRRDEKAEETMKRSTDDLTNLLVTRQGGTPIDENAFARRLKTAIAEVVQQQASIGLSVVNDGEFGRVSWRPEYERFCQQRVEAINHALAGIPEDMVRYHICWGSHHGPHSTDIALRDILPILFKVKASGLVFEAGNVRHEHEWQIWQDTKLPEGKILIPGVISHATNTVEHPELVALRIKQFAKLVGPENVIAGTDCGMGYRVHPQVGWAKLKSLCDGARLASNELY